MGGVKMRVVAYEAPVLFITWRNQLFRSLLFYITVSARCSRETVLSVFQFFFRVKVVCLTRFHIIIFFFTDKSVLPASKLFRKREKFSTKRRFSYFVVLVITCFVFFCISLDFWRDVYDRTVSLVFLDRLIVEIFLLVISVNARFGGRTGSHGRIWLFTMGSSYAAPFGRYHDASCPRPSRFLSRSRSSSSCRTTTDCYTDGFAHAPRISLLQVRRGWCVGGVFDICYENV